MSRLAWSTAGSATCARFHTDSRPNGKRLTRFARRLTLTVRVRPLRFIMRCTPAARRMFGLSSARERGQVAKRTLGWSGPLLTVIISLIQRLTGVRSEQNRLAVAPIFRCMPMQALKNSALLKPLAVCSRATAEGLAQAPHQACLQAMGLPATTQRTASNLD